MAEFPTDNPNTNVLALAGGGYLGLFSAEVLAGLEADGPSLFETTDLFAGTSVGALIALGLAAGVPAATIADTMRAEGERIFPALKTFPVGGPRVQAVFQRGRTAAFDPTPLRETLTTLLGERRLGELERRVIVPALNLSVGAFHLFRGGGDSVDAEKTLVDVAMASAAAPTYFPPHRIGDELFADGGLAANAPDALAVLEAQKKLGAAPHRIRLLSVGTTRGAVGEPAHAGGTDWGMKDWLPRLMEVSMAGQMTLARETVGFLLEERRHLLIDPVRSPNQEAIVRLDNASEEAKATLGALAADTLRTLAANETASRFIHLWQGHAASGPT